MKYVFYQVFYSSSAPKAAGEIIQMMKQTVGSEMLKMYYPEFFKALKDLVVAANASGKHAPFRIESNSGIRYDDNRKHGQISVFQPYKWGQKDVARLEYIEVDSMWAARTPHGDIKQYTFTEWDRLKYRNEQEKKGGQS